MHNPSPFDMIRKATSQTNTSDRWAALLNNTQERIPVTQEAPPARQPEQSYESPPCDAVYPQLMEPPFPPPQARHPMLDEIAQRHIRAHKNAKQSQAWVSQQAQETLARETAGEAKE